MMKEILNLSYNCLPQYLKTCLLYLSIYPEGYTIWKADLVKQWVAEDFIVPTEGKDRKEVAESYFNELINRRLIHPNNIKHIDGALSCTVHPIVLNIIKCKSKEDNFTTVIDYPQIITGLSTKVRRLSLQLSSAKHAIKPASVAVAHVRSLAFFGLLECIPLIWAFKLLRVLVLEIWGHQECTSLDLTRISALIHLRYIKITCDAMVELPDQIVGLQDLETLEVDARVSSIPLDIIYLPRLLHLCLRYVESLPNGIGRIRSLRALQYFDLGSNSENNVWSLGQLMDLQDLHLTCSAPPSAEHLKRNLAALAFSLGKLCRLKSLTLAPCPPGAAGLPFEGPTTVSPPVFIQRLVLLPPTCIFSGLPAWVGKLRKLHVLKIAVRELHRNDINCLGGLPALVVFSLYVHVARVGTVIIKPASFPALRNFSFRSRVLSMAFRAGAMSNLQKLKIGFKAQTGKQYGRMLGGIEHLLNLQEITGEIATASTVAHRHDRKAADTAFWNAIEVSRQKWQDMGEYSMFPRVNVKWADWMVLEEAFAHHEEGSGGLVTTTNGDPDCYELPFPHVLLPFVISFTSPLDACRCFAVCKAFQAEASRDQVWDHFIPPDYRSVLSRATDPVDVDIASTKKELFMSLSEQHILIDEGNTSFWLERTTGAKSYMLAAKSLNITWGGTPQYWRWIALPDSRFKEVAELVDVCWLDIIATIECRELSPNTRYTAYMVFKLADRSYGLDSPTQKACISIAGTVSARWTISLYPRTRQQRSRMGSSEREKAVRYPRERSDGWMEVEMGEFYIENLDDGTVEIRLREHETLNWKSGLIVEGVEIRPVIGSDKRSTNWLF